MPSGEGRSHFMMQYYAYILMFVVFDVMAIFLYAWGASLFSLPHAATLPMMAFLGIMFAAYGLCFVLGGQERNLVEVIACHIILTSIKYLGCKHEK